MDLMEVVRVLNQNDLVNSQEHIRDDRALKLLTATDVSELLQVKKSWVYREARAGRIPHLRLGRYRRFRADAIEQWAAALEGADAASVGGGRHR